MGHDTKDEGMEQKADKIDFSHLAAHAASTVYHLCIVDIVVQQHLTVTMKAETLLVAWATVEHNFEN